MIFVIFLLLGYTSYSQPQQVELKPMQDYYFLGDATHLKDGVNCYVITSRKDFKKIFGETNRPDTPFFDREWMLVLLMPKTQWHNKVDFQQISMKAGHYIEVYCKVVNSNKKLTYDFFPIKVCRIPKYKGVTKIKFYNERHMRPLSVVDVD